ncbi:T9SS type A sorting domain-containing protein [Aureispira sp. CCB-QB1]|uniref:T9SS type A sorting domain-containing protein n=1 Tax=Aureispira sp. CCB-QB1 TaxID=1313421 RepID=UPI000697E0D4|nr:T9SS type A sorting domain-containing protein [Aureispira sp. CCB-QB1]
MKDILLLNLVTCLLLFNTPLLKGQNSLLQAPATASLTSYIDGLELVSNGTDVVLVATSSNDTALYAIDIADNNSLDAINNTLTAIPDFTNVLSGVTGLNASDIVVANIEVNPISKSIYVLVRNQAATQSQIVLIKNNGANVSVLNTNNLIYSKIKLSSSRFNYQDMTYGDDTLYVTSGGWSLDGELVSISTPFVNGTLATERATSMFKTNQGSVYLTDAPLEKLDFGVVNGVKRLMGVTLCAPGFSIKTSDVPGTGVLAVKEVFNVRYDPPIKVIHQQQNGTSYLFNLHDDFNFGALFMRIGEHYIDGTPETTNTFNNNTVHLRNFPATGVSAGLTDADFKIYNNHSFEMIAFFDHYNMVVLESDTLKLFATGINLTNTQVTNSKEMNITCSPNPAQDFLQLHLKSENLGFASSYNRPVVKIYTVNGQEIFQKELSSEHSTINIKTIPPGKYIVIIKQDEKVLFHEKLLITD